MGDRCAIKLMRETPPGTKYEPTKLVAISHVWDSVAVLGSHAVAELNLSTLALGTIFTETDPGPGSFHDAEGAFLFGDWVLLKEFTTPYGHYFMNHKTGALKTLQWDTFVESANENRLGNGYPAAHPTPVDLATGQAYFPGYEGAYVRADLDELLVGLNNVGTDPYIFTRPNAVYPQFVYLPFSGGALYYKGTDPATGYAFGLKQSAPYTFRLVNLDTALDVESWDTTASQLSLAGSSGRGGSKGYYDAEDVFNLIYWNDTDDKSIRKIKFPTGGPIVDEEIISAANNPLGISEILTIGGRYMYYHSHATYDPTGYQNKLYRIDISSPPATTVELVFDDQQFIDVLGAPYTTASAKPLIALGYD